MTTRWPFALQRYLFCQSSCGNWDFLGALTINSFSSPVKTKLNMGMPQGGYLFKTPRLMFFTAVTCWSTSTETRRLTSSGKHFGYSALAESSESRFQTSKDRSLNIMIQPMRMLSSKRHFSACLDQDHSRSGYAYSC